MKISHDIKISPHIKHKNLLLLRMKQHKYGKNLYIICTSYQQGYLFEILPSNQVSQRYDKCYALGVSKTKKEAIEFVQQFIEAIYLKKITTLEELKSSKRGSL